MKRRLIVLSLGILGAIALVLLVVPANKPLISGEISSRDLREVMLACRRVDDSIRSKLFLKNGHSIELFQLWLADLRIHSHMVDVVKTNRVYVTTLRTAGPKSRYLVTHYRGEWRAAILGPER